MINKRSCLRIGALVLVLSILSLSACSAGSVMHLRPDTGVITPADDAGEKYHIGSGAITGAEKSVDYTLGYGKTDGNVTVATADGSASFSALTRDAYAKKTSAVMSFLLCDEDGELFEMNTQDNGVATGGLSTEALDGGVRLSYTLTREPSDADVQDVPVMRVSLLLTLEGSVLSASVDCASIELPEEWRLLKLVLLPGFGTALSCKNGDVLLLPDGCGAYVDLTSAPEQDESNRLLCYGKDAGTGEVEGIDAAIPFFALRRSGITVCALAEDADALCSFVYKRYAGENGCSVYPEFAVSAYEQVDGGLYVAQPYTGKIAMSYTFAQDTATDYSAMASVCRERLVRTGVLPMKTLDAPEYATMLLTVVADTDGTKDGSCTTLEETRQMLSVLKAKGVHSVSARLLGVLSGGMNQEDISSAGFNSVIGSSSDRKALEEYATLQSLGIYYNVELLRTSSRGSGLSSLSGNSADVPAVTAADSFFAPDSKKYSLASLSEVEGNIDRVMTLFPESAISLGDVSRVLYSDSSCSYNRQQAKDYIVSSCKSLNVTGGLWLSYPALYLLKYADYTDGVPMTCSLSEAQGVTAVPFLQIVLHGAVCYAGGTLNLSGDMQEAVLKSVEFGCLPSALFTYRTLDSAADAYYAEQSPRVAKYYTKINDSLSDLYGERITGHTQIRDGVYCVEYANTSLVYINYTYNSVDINGIRVEARDFTRIN